MFVSIIVNVIRGAACSEGWFSNLFSHDKAATFYKRGLIHFSSGLNVDSVLRGRFCLRAFGPKAKAFPRDTVDVPDLTNMFKRFYCINYRASSRLEDFFIS